MEVLQKTSFKLFIILLLIKIFIKPINFTTMNYIVYTIVFLLAMVYPVMFFDLTYTIIYAALFLSFFSVLAIAKYREAKGIK